MSEKLRQNLRIDFWMGKKEKNNGWVVGFFFAVPTGTKKPIGPWEWHGKQLNTHVRVYSLCDPMIRVGVFFSETVDRMRVSHVGRRAVFYVFLLPDVVSKSAPQRSSWQWLLWKKNRWVGCLSCWSRMMVPNESTVQATIYNDDLYPIWSMYGIFTYTYTLNIKSTIHEI